MRDTETPCPNCGNPTTAGWAICQSCLRRYIEDIGSLAHVIPALRALADRTARIGGRSHAPSRGVAPLPISTHWQEQWERASRLMLDIASTVDIRYSLLRPESWRKAWRKAISNRNSLAASGRTPDLMLDLHATLIDFDGMMRERDPRVTVVSCTECGQRIAAPFGMRPVTVRPVAFAWIWRRWSRSMSGTRVRAPWTAVRPSWRRGFPMSSDGACRASRSSGCCGRAGCMAASALARQVACGGG